jgi:hypothetical protein
MPVPCRLRRNRSPVPELWALCTPCERWFCLPSDSGAHLASTRCETCSGAPAQFEMRTPTSSFSVEVAPEMLDPDLTF